MRNAIYLLAFLLMAGSLGPPTSTAQDNDKMKRLMVDKLRNAQTLLEGLATRNFSKITRSGEELIQLSKTAEWFVLRTPQYEVHSNEFRCHDYVREVREARLPVKRPGLAYVGGGNELGGR